MRKRTILLLLAVILLFTLAAPASLAAEPVTDVRLESGYAGHDRQATITGYSKSGAVVWTKKTDPKPATELEAFEPIGIWQDVYYYNDGGTITALDKDTGAVRWRNSEFRGESIHSYVDEQGTVYACGFYGPDFFAVDKNGVSRKKISSFSEHYFWPVSLEKVGDSVLCVNLVGGQDGYEHDIRYYVDMTDLSVSPSLTALQDGVTAYNASAQELHSLEKLLSYFQWYATPDSAYDCTKPDGILRGIIENPLPLDYSDYPVEQPDMAWTQRKDPLGKWDHYWRFSEKSVDWVLQNVFSLTKDQIAKLKSGFSDKNAYRYNGSWYSVPYGVGGGYDVEIESLTYDGVCWRAAYHVGDMYGQDHGIYYAVLGKSSENGKDYWSLRYNGRTESAARLPFLDIPATAWFAAPVDWAYREKITSGTSDLTFGPNGACTRAHAVTFLWRAAGAPRVSGATGFSDVPDSAYFADAVKWAVKNGVTNGVGGGKFNPNGVCSRAQIVSFLYRAAGSPSVSGGSSFSDVASDAYYANAVKWAVQNGVTSGTGNGRFSPNAACTRGQIVTFLYRWYA